jgi:hypothetical protein
MHRKKTPDPKENDNAPEMKAMPRKKVKQIQDDSLKSNLIDSDVRLDRSVYIIQGR